MDRRPAILYIGPSVSWKGYLEAIKAEGLVAVACIAEDYSDGPMNDFLPFRDLKAHGGASALGFEALIVHREPYRILEQARTLEEQKLLRFVGVLRAHEADTAVIDFVAAGLGAPHNPLATLLARRDKAAMKDALQEAGLAHAAFTRVVDSVQVADAVSRLGLPVVVKTPSCASSSDVFVCGTAELATQRVRELLGRPSPWGEYPSYILVEEYLDGQEYAVNVFADGKGKAMVTDVWAYERQQTLGGHVLYCAVRSVDPSAVPEACSYALGVCRAVGIQMEAGHVELKLTKRGPVMVEVGARRPGGQKTEMLARMVPDWNPFTAQVRAACGREVAMPRDVSPAEHARHLFFHVARKGFVEAVEGLEATRALKSCFSLSVRVKVGEAVPETTDIVSCAAFLWLVGGDQRQLDADELAARSLLKIVIGDSVDEKAGKSCKARRLD